MIAVFFYRADETRASPMTFPLINRSVCRSPAAGGYTFYNTIAPPFYPPYARFPICPIPQARLFSLQSSIAVCPSCQGLLALAAENLPLRHIEERISRILLDRTDRQSLGQKNNQPFDTGRIRGKNKKLN